MGNQVAFNKAFHLTAEVWENDDGEFYVTNIKDNHYKLIRGEYNPIGNKMYYPEKWGKKAGSLKLLEHLISNDEILIEKAKIRLEKLKKCKDVIENEWK
jgi:hypothetical protein